MPRVSRSAGRTFAVSWAVRAAQADRDWNLTPLAATAYHRRMALVLKVGFPETPLDSSAALIAFIVAAGAVAIFAISIAVVQRLLGD